MGGASLELIPERSVKINTMDHERIDSEDELENELFSTHAW